MSIGIMSDVHLGSSRFHRFGHSGVNSYRKRNWEAFHEACMELASHVNDDDPLCAVIISGDLFDTFNPDVMDIAVAIRELSCLVDAGIEVHVLSGNHDHGPAYDRRGFHAFELLEPLEGIHLHTEPEVVSIHDGDNDALVSFLPHGFNEPKHYGFLSEQLAKKAVELKLEGYQSFLVAHGSIAPAHCSERPAEAEGYWIPRSVALRYDLTVLGHVHLPSVTMGTNRKKKVCILVPGSLMPSSMSLQVVGQDVSPSVWIRHWDHSVERIRLSTPPSMLEMHVPLGDINEALLDVYENHAGDIVALNYNGLMSDVDDALYKKAYEGCMHLALHVKNPSLNIDSDAYRQQPKPEGFWQWCEENHADWVDDLRNRLKGGD